MKSKNIFMASLFAIGLLIGTVELDGMQTAQTPKNKIPNDPKSYIEDLLKKNGCSLAPYKFGGLKQNCGGIAGASFKTFYVTPEFFTDFNDERQLEILLHEKGHLVNHHVLKRYIFCALPLIPEAFLIKKMSDKFLQTGGSPTGIAFQLLNFVLICALSRRYEKTADLYAFRHLPSREHQKATVQFYEEYEKKTKDTALIKWPTLTFFSYHPDNATRVRYMKAWIENPPKPYVLPKLSTPSNSDIEKIFLLDC